MSGIGLDTSIEIGKHVVRTIGGLTFNMDTVWATVISGGLVLVLGFIARHAITKNTEDHVPTKLQLIWETVVKEVNTQVADNLGRLHPLVVPMALALFFFILFSNWLELIPSEPNGVHLLPAPTADVNLTYAMALVVMVCVWVYAVRQQGFGYVKHFFQPYPVMAPLNLIEEVVKPFTLALRLFGNIFAGGIMISLIGLLPWFGLVPGNIVWKLFDAFIGAIQAFIFGLLTVIYFGMASAGHGSDHADEAAEPHTQPAH